MIKVLNYQNGHADQLIKRDVFKDEDHSDSISFLVGLGKAAAKTIMYGDKMLAIVGVNFIHRGVAECWSITSDLVKEHPVSFHKTVLLLLKFVEREFNVHRFQMVVRRDYPEGQKWAKSLGFFEESVMGRYDVDKAHVSMYVRFA